MKKLLLIAVTLVANLSYAQWVYKTVDNGLDVPYKIAYSMSSDNKGVLKLEKTEEGIALYITGSYFCDDYPTIDIALMVNSEPQRYSFYATKSSDNTTVFILNDLSDVDRRAFLNDFQRATSFIARVNETRCTSDIFKFNMSGSLKAYEFMLK